MKEKNRNATDIAIESADVVLIGEWLGAVVDAYQIGKTSYRKTFRTYPSPLPSTGSAGRSRRPASFTRSGQWWPCLPASARCLPTPSPGGCCRSGARAVPRSLPSRFPICTEGCLAAIRGAACKLKGVEEVTGDPKRQIVTVTYRKGEAVPDGIREAIIERGFQVA
nr:heavy-metal-associated domain-containing protein [Candidatus Manganitrophus noduliformans]